MNKGNQSPGVASCKGPKDLVQGFTEVQPADERANQGDSDVLRKPGKVGPRDIDVPQKDEEREEFQRGGIEPLESEYTP